MEEFKPKRKNNNYSGTDKAGAPRRAPRQNHQNKPPHASFTAIRSMSIGVSVI